MERIPAQDYHSHAGHVARYEWAKGLLQPGDRVHDIACGVGYGAEVLGSPDYHGYDVPGVPNLAFPGTFYEVDLNDKSWFPEHDSDVTICFETLEHLEDPRHLATVLKATTKRDLLVSVPTQPTRHMNPYHLHDFDVRDIENMFAPWRVRDRWEQPEELSHVWHFCK